MTDETAAPSGGNDIGMIEAPADTGGDLSISQATKALVAGRTRKPEQTAESAEEPATADNELSVEDNAAPDADQAHGEDQEADRANEPPIERPKSWTESEEAEWRATPRALQQKIAARELERDTALRRTQNEAAEKLKGLTAKEQQAEQARQQYESQLPNLKQAMLRAQSEAFPDIKTWDDVKNLQRTDPFRYQEWDVHQKELAIVDAQTKEVEARQTQEKQSKRNAYEAEQNKLLIELVPEMADPKKANELRGRAVAMLTDDLGLKNDQLSRWMADDTGHEILSNAGIQKLIADGLKYRDIQAAPKAVAAKPVPPVQRPGTAKPSGNANSERIQALTQSLNSTGSLKAAQELRAAQVRAQQRRTG